MPIYVETHSEHVPTGYRVLLASAYGYRRSFGKSSNSGELVGTAYRVVQTFLEKFNKSENPLIPFPTVSLDSVGISCPFPQSFLKLKN
jgi:hypothetical protein